MNAITAITQDRVVQMSLPDLIKKKRLELGLTQKELAEKAGISLSMLKQIETGRSEPTMPKVKQIATVLELSANDIWTELPVGTVTDEKLRLTVMSETVHFLSGKAKTLDLEQVRKLVAELSGAEKIKSESPDLPEPELTAVEILAELVKSRGLRSRKITVALASAQIELVDADFDELVDLAEEHNVVFADELEKGQESIGASRFICAILYQKDIMNQSLAGLEIIRNWLENELFDEDEFGWEPPKEVRKKGFLEDAKVAELRLRRHLPGYVLEKAISRNFLPETALPVDI